MKHYYRITDALVQAAILVVWLVTFFTNIDVFGRMYFIAGGWFFVSLIVHHMVSSQKYQDTYSSFLVISIALVAIAGIGFIVHVLWFFEAITLFYVAPFFALLYTITCIAEVKYLTKRPMSYLK